MRKSMPLSLPLRSCFAVALLALAATPALALTDSHSDQLGFSELGYVSSHGSLEYEHVFDPYFDSSIEISSIDGAWLTVAVADDLVCRTVRACANDWFFASEVAVIELDSVVWESGSATAAIFFGDVTADANLLLNGGVLHVTVRSDYGDFNVLRSTLYTVYTYEEAGVGGGGSGANHAPEPGAALVFAIGALLIGHGSRSRASARS